MNNKNILIFLVLLLVYINVFIPLSEKNHKLVKNINATKQSLSKDKLYLVQSKRIKKELKHSIETNEIYKERYFYNEDSAEIFNIMQKEIKALIKQSNTHEDIIKWGEKYKDEELLIFPINVRVSGSVKDVGAFFDAIDKNEKIKIKDIVMQRTKEHYILKTSLFGLKRKQK